MKNAVYGALGFAACGLLLALTLYFWRFSGSGLGDQEAFALFGDFMGGFLNPILGFATILILLRSLSLQNEEMKASREELELTRQEMAKARKVQSDDLDFQARSNLRTQLHAIFEEAQADFLAAWHKVQVLESVSDEGLISDSFEQIYKEKISESNRIGWSSGAYYDYWDIAWNRPAALEIRSLYAAAWQASVALVEYSDTSLQTDKIRRFFVVANDKMEKLNLHDEARLVDDLGALDFAIQARKEAKFPPFHIGRKI